ncbi:hypothetical protein CGH50_29020, partial [Vibrio parahaemolyticus]
VISDEQHPRNGTFLRASDLNLPFEGEALSDSDPYVIVEEQSGQFGVHTQTEEATLFVDKTVSLASGKVRVKSSLQR